MGISKKTGLIMGAAAGAVALLGSGGGYALASTTAASPTPLYGCINSTTRDISLAHTITLPNCPSGTFPFNTGAQGATGPAGPAGPKGDTGASGQDGAIGPQGPKGDTGATGEAGPQGSKGDTGATGAIGPAGPDGPKGDIGDTGPQGPKGDTGDTGSQGPAGQQGPQGLPGATTAGPSGLNVEEVSTSIVDKTHGGIFVLCPSDHPIVLGGGGESSSGAAIVASQPVYAGSLLPGSYTNVEQTNATPGNGWYVHTTDSSMSGTAFAICAK